MQLFNGFDLFEDRYMTVTEEDWSRVRSRSRAERRRRQGKRQNVRYVERPNPDVVMAGNTIIGHPDTLRQLIHKVSEQTQEQTRPESATPRSSPQSSTETNANEPLTSEKLLAALEGLPPIRRDIFDFTLPRRIYRDRTDD